MRLIVSLSLLKEVCRQKCYMLKCDYIALEYEGRYIPFWNLTLLKTESKRRIVR